MYCVRMETHISLEAYGKDVINSFLLAYMGDSPNLPDISFHQNRFSTYNLSLHTHIPSIHGEYEHYYIFQPTIRHL